MRNYKITLHSGQVAQVQDKRSLTEITSLLCRDGFIVVARQTSPYSTDLTETAYLERAVASIEPSD